MEETFGQRLSQLIAVRGLTQGEFARKLSASPAFVSDMIRGVKKPGSDFLSRLATEFNVSLDWLLLGKGSMAGVINFDDELLRLVALRVELARQAAEGVTEAQLLIDELLGKSAANSNSVEERQLLLKQLAHVADMNSIISKLYNEFLTNQNYSTRASEVLLAAISNFSYSSSDPLVAMVASRSSM
jgi:transcriptional regulator with XRE-family HTH domain